MTPSTIAATLTVSSLTKPRCVAVRSIRLTVPWASAAPCSSPLVAAQAALPDSFESAAGELLVVRIPKPPFSCRFKCRLQWLTELDHFRFRENLPPFPSSLLSLPFSRTTPSLVVRGAVSLHCDFLPAAPVSRRCPFFCADEFLRGLGELPERADHCIPVPCGLWCTQGTGLMPPAHKKRPSERIE